MLEKLSPIATTAENTMTEQWSESALGKFCHLCHITVEDDKVEDDIHPRVFRKERNDFEGEKLPQQVNPMANRMFHKFALLPTELRLQIWDMTVESRNVEIRTVPMPARKKYEPLVISSIPVPASLQTCHESRDHLQRRYKQYFADSTTGNHSGIRRLWLNLDADMVSIDIKTPFEALEPIASSVKRLRFERDGGDHLGNDWPADSLKMFVNLVEVHVVCVEGLRSWRRPLKRLYWPCGEENVRFIDPDRDGPRGKMYSGREMEELLDSEDEPELLCMLFD